MTNHCNCANRFASQQNLATHSTEAATTSNHPSANPIPIILCTSAQYGAKRRQTATGNAELG